MCLKCVVKDLMLLLVSGLEQALEWTLKGHLCGLFCGAQYCGVLVVDVRCGSSPGLNRSTGSNHCVLGEGEVDAEITAI